MTTARRRQSTWAIAASLIAHVAVGVFLVIQHPTLPLPYTAPGPPQAIIPLLLMPRTPPTAGRLSPSQPIRLHRRPQPYATPEVAPALIAPPAPPAAAASPAPKAVPAFHPAPQPEGPKDEVRTVLRQSPVGCANAQAVGLNRAERDLCDEKFGKGAKDAAFAGLGLAPDKLKSFDAIAAKKDADRKYRETYGAPGMVTPGEIPLHPDH